jgi:hypothetical protein
MKSMFSGFEAARLRVCLLTFAVSAAFLGCGGADTTSGPPKPDENAAKRQQEMNDFYSKNPLPKPKAK